MKQSAQRSSSSSRCILHIGVLLLSSLPAMETAESSTALPQNFVPMIDGVTARPAELPGILAAPDEKGKICTLASLEATIVLWPRGEESQEIRIEMPDRGVSASSQQKCPLPTNADLPFNSKPLLVVTWSSFQLCFFISQNDRNWTLDRITFSFNSSEVPLGSSKSEVKVFASEANALTEWRAPIGSSYRCWAQKQYPLLPSSNDSKDNATLIFSNFQLQPFLTDDLKVFGDELMCQEDTVTTRRRRRRDDTVTIAVGSTLAVVAVVIVLGYAVFRHIKIKAVGYGTMQ